MTSITTPAAAGHQGQRRWRIIAGTTGAVAGAAVVAGAFLPWVETFAGLLSIPGVRGSYGRILAAMGAGIAAAALWHVIRGGRWARWLIAAGGFAALGFSGYLLIQLAATTRTLGGDSMVLARGGPGLWVVAAGSLAAFATVFLPAVPAAPAAKREPGVAPRAARPVWPLALAGRASRLRRAVLRWTADPHSAGTRRGLQVALGLVWLLDAALQFQPYMFGRGFVTGVLTPAEAGNPGAVASPALWAARLISHDVPAWNSAFAVIQVAVALGLLWRPTVKAALAASIVWALSVWWLGEGLGGLLTGAASPLTGAPGAVILYALIALLAWPRGPDRLGSDVAAGGLLGYRGARLAWLLLWGGLAYLMLQPAVRAGAGLRAAIAGNAAGEPGWLAALDRHVAAVIGPHGPAVAIGLAAVFVLAGAGLLIPATARPAVLLAAAAGLAIWVLGENFGMILMGNATDPNTGPLLVLLAAAYWPRRALGSAAAARATHTDGAPRHPVDAGHPT
jgi:hypothetical protein